MRVCKITTRIEPPCSELSGEIDGYRVWFRFPDDHPPALRGDPYVAAALLPAMLRGESIELDDDSPVSPRLLDGIGRIQDVLRLWYPRLRKIEIKAERAAAIPTGRGVCSFYSGGVDGIYTFLNHANVITDLLFVKGIDMQLENDALFDEVVHRNGEFARTHGVRLVPIASNVRFFGHRYKPLNWDSYQACGLASLALASGHTKVYVAATHTYAELFPWGSHPLIDGWWSTEATEIIHDGAEARRSEKLVRIADDKVAMQHLRVCWQDAGYNCGRCEKCLRTMVALYLLNLHSPALPPLHSVKLLRKVRPHSESDVTYFLDNIALAERANQPGIARALRRGLNRFRRRKLLIEADRVLFNGWVRRLIRKLAGRSLRSLTEA
jgi:hypothetical protein